MLVLRFCKNIIKEEEPQTSPEIFRAGHSYFVALKLESFERLHGGFESVTPNHNTGSGWLSQHFRGYDHSVCTRNQ
jgi:hypothetical protein